MLSLLAQEVKKTLNLQYTSSLNFFRKRFTGYYQHEWHGNFSPLASLFLCSFGFPQTPGIDASTTKEPPSSLQFDRCENLRLSYGFEAKERQRERESGGEARETCELLTPVRRARAIFRQLSSCPLDLERNLEACLTLFQLHRRCCGFQERRRSRKGLQLMAGLGRGGE